MTAESVTDAVATELRALDALAESADLVAGHAIAVRTSVDLVDHLTTADLRRPTPCADWTLHGLLTHMIAQHYGFAAASRGDADPQVWKIRRLGDDPAADYRAAADHVLAAFAEPDVLRREFPLPEFSPTHLFSGAQAVAFHFIDYVVHSWDVARTLDLPVDFPPAVLETARPVALAVPGGPARLAPGAAFAPEVPTSSPDALDELVALLGRTPTWSGRTVVG